MPNYNCVLNFHSRSLDDSHSPRYITLRNAVLIPIFCVCLITAIGNIAGVRHVVTMQFVVDRNTEYIVSSNTAFLFGQLDVNNGFNSNIKSN